MGWTQSTVFTKYAKYMTTNIAKIFSILYVMEIKKSLKRENQILANQEWLAKIVQKFLPMSLFAIPSVETLVFGN